MPQAALIIPAVMAVIGTAVSTISSVSAAKANAANANAESDALRAQGALATADQRRETERVLSKQRALGAASGVDPSSGSSLEIALDTAFTGEMNALKTKYRYDTGVAAKQSEAAGYKSQIPGLVIGGATKAFGSAASAYFGGGAAGAGSSLLSDWASQNRGGTNWNIPDMSRKFNFS